LLRSALDALQQHHDRISYRDFIGVANSSLPEIVARLGPGRLIYADNGKVTA
jgi:hypothetical protein